VLVVLRERRFIRRFRIL